MAGFSGPGAVRGGLVTASASAVAQLPYALGFQGYDLRMLVHSILGYVVDTSARVTKTRAR